MFAPRSSQNRVLSSDWKNQLFYARAISLRHLDKKHLGMDSSEVPAKTRREPKKEENPRTKRSGLRKLEELYTARLRRWKSVQEVRKKIEEQKLARLKKEEQKGRDLSEISERSGTTEWSGITGRSGRTESSGRTRGRRRRTQGNKELVEYYPGESRRVGSSQQGDKNG